MRILTTLYGYYTGKWGCPQKDASHSGLAWFRRILWLHQLFGLPHQMVWRAWGVNRVKRPEDSTGQAVSSQLHDYHLMQKCVLCNFLQVNLLMVKMIAGNGKGFNFRCSFRFMPQCKNCTLRNFGTWHSSRGGTQGIECFFSKRTCHSGLSKTVHMYSIRNLSPLCCYWTITLSCCRYAPWLFFHLRKGA